MIVLHGTWKAAIEIQERGDFFLWGESSTPVPAKRKGRPTPLPHPFQASHDDISKIITSIDFANKGAKKARKVGAIIMLPSISNSPQPSPDLIREDDSENGKEKVGLSAWKIEGLSLPPEDAVSLLSMFSGFWTGIEGFAIGTDLRFWSKVSKFAMELLSKQHFVPGIVSSNGLSYARWQYVLNDQDDIMRMSMLAGGMPPICRAMDGLPNNPEAILTGFVNSAIDGCIRRWIPLSEMSSKTKGLSSAWLESLATGQPIKTNTHGIKNLSEGIRSWKEPIHEIERSGFRTCFRLEPPPADEGWSLRYFLQASDDPSLLVPAEDVWKESRDTLSFLTRKFDHPQEKLLADLGRASRLFPPIEDSLNMARPVATQLGTQQAYAFLKEAAPLLSESGFGVLIPPWWNKGAPGLGIKLNVTPKREPKTGKGIFTFNSIINYDWQLALGAEAISEEEFEHLSSLKEPLVRIRGQWVELKKDEIDAAIKFFRSRNTGEMKLSEAIKLGIGLGEAQTGLPIAGFEAKGSLSSLFEQLSGRKGIKQIRQPGGFTGELRPYQVKGFSWLAFLRQYGLGACLADDMGLGKTIQLLALLLNDKEEGNVRPTLLICPTSVVGNWQREAKKFAPSLRVLVHHGINRRKKEFLNEVLNYDIVISTYALTHRDEDVLARVEWNGVVLDEAQNIKNSSTKQSQAVRRLKAGYRIALTGTPVENRLSELWSIMEFLNPGYLGSEAGFRRTFAIPVERYNDKGAGSRLRSIVTPFVLRRLKTDSSIIKDLPDKIEIKEHCNLTKEQATLYEAVVRDMLRKIEDSEGIERKGAVLSALMRLKQVCNHPAQFLGDGSSIPERSGKLNRITEMLEEVLAGGDSALIFTQFAGMGDLLKAHFRKVFGQEVLFLHGGVNQKQRDGMVMKFSEKNGPRIFILSLKAGGVGLNLTRANHVFHFDRWWNPAVENQATDRAFRIGQKKNVLVHKFICDGTLEERIDEMIELKKELAENIIGTGEGWLTEMTTQQLKELFTLRKEAVSDE